jgi:mono/diheme cytochrome c family protein
MYKELSYITQGVLLFIALAVLVGLLSIISSIQTELPQEEKTQIATSIPRPLSGIAIKGKSLYKENCASCHGLIKNIHGPALAGLEKRWSSKKLLYMWINNWQKAVATGDPYANMIKDFSPAAMSNFNFSDEEIDSILAYINESSDSQRSYSQVANNE